MITSINSIYIFSTGKAVSLYFLQEKFYLYIFYRKSFIYIFSIVPERRALAPGTVLIYPRPPPVPILQSWSMVDVQAPIEAAAGISEQLIARVKASLERRTAKEAEFKAEGAWDEEDNEVLQEEIAPEEVGGCYT